MTDDRSLERAARSFIEAGPTQAPDRAVEAALLRIETTPQERDLRIPWRFPSMTTPARLAVAALVGVLLVGGGFYFFGKPSQPAVGGPGPSPSASAPASPASSPSPTSSAAGSPPDYKSIQGWIVFEHFGQAPDGSTTTFDPDRRQIWLVKADGSGLHELAPGNPAEGKASPDISPDGNKVIFNSWEDPTQIWEVSIEGGQPVLVSTDCAAATACLEHDPTYSPDGKRVAFMRVEGTGSSQSSVIGVRDLDTHEVTLLETTRVLLATGDLAQPTWSPDGLQIAYHRNTQTPTDERPTKIRIEIVNVDGTGLRELPVPVGEAEAGDPDWSPDGSLIVFSTMANREGEGTGGSTGIFTIHPDGTGLTDLCGDCLQGGIAPTWTADGKHIMFWGFRTWALMDPDGANMAHINSSKLTYYGDRLGYGYFGMLQPTP
jgi:dipeptidyl aminopeptidase/acylaminoacyl peptidase